MENDIIAKVSSRGQVTIPKPIRDALEISGGEEIMFRLEQGRAVLVTDENRPEPLPVAPVAVSTPPPPRAPWDATRRTLLSSRAKPQQPTAPIPEPPDPEFTIDLRAVVDAEVDDDT